jgi:hypothetical protein
LHQISSYPKINIYELNAAKSKCCTRDIRRLKVGAFVFDSYVVRQDDAANGSSPGTWKSDAMPVQTLLHVSMALVSGPQPRKCIHSKHHLARFWALCSRRDKTTVLNNRAYASLIKFEIRLRSSRSVQATVCFFAKSEGDLPPSAF